MPRQSVLSHIKRNRSESSASRASVPQTKTLESSTTSEACLVCGAGGGERCKDKNGRAMGRPHKARYKAD